MILFLLPDTPTTPLLRLWDLNASPHLTRTKKREKKWYGVLYSDSTGFFYSVSEYKNEVGQLALDFLTQFPSTIVKKLRPVMGRLYFAVGNGFRFSTAQGRQRQHAQW